MLAPDVTQDRDVIQQWAAFGVLMVIAVGLFGFPAVRHFGCDRHGKRRSYRARRTVYPMPDMG